MGEGGCKKWYRGSYSCIEITVTSDDLIFTIDPIVSERMKFPMSKQSIYLQKASENILCLNIFGTAKLSAYNTKTLSNIHCNFHVFTVHPKIGAINCLLS